MEENEIKPDPRALALGRLGVREYSAAEMQAYLRRKGFPADESKRVVESLAEEKLIDDQRYAAVIARDQAKRDKGPGQIMAKLMQKGVRMDRKTAQALFNEASDCSELTLAQSVLERRYPRAAEGRKERQRAYMGLVRRGFSSDVIRQAISSIVGSAADCPIDHSDSGDL